jgi:hypothetical protein
MIGIDAQPFVAVGQRPLHLAVDGALPAQAVPGGGIARIDVRRLLQIADGAVPVVLGFEGECPVAQRQGVVRLELQRRGEVAYRLVVVGLVAPGIAAVVEGIGIVGLQPDRLVVVHDRLVVLALVAPGDAAVVEGLVHGRPELERLS